MIETIDRLCNIINDLSDLCKKQAEIIAQSDIECDELTEKQNAIENEMDLVEYALRN